MFCFAKKMLYEYCKSIKLLNAEQCTQHVFRNSSFKVVMATIQSPVEVLLNFVWLTH